MTTLKRPRIGGRQKGTPNKATADVRKAAQGYTHEALETLAQLMRTSRSDQVRLQAAIALLDRAHGRPARAAAPAPKAKIEPRHWPNPFVIPDNGRRDLPCADDDDGAPLIRAPDYATWPRAG